MNDEQLKIFHAVAQNGSFSRAEEQMHISKQAMLKQMNCLEDELGFPLFTRSRSGVALTPAGALFQKEMQHIAQEITQLVQRCREASGTADVLRVGNVEHQALLSPVTSAFAARYPGIHIHQVIHPNHSGEWRVANGIQDVAETFYLAYQSHPNRFEYRALTSIPYVAAVGSQHPLAGRRIVTLKDLTPYPTMLFPMMWENSHLSQLRQAFAGNEAHLVERADVDNQVAAAYECLENKKILLTANPFIEGIRELKKIPLQEDWQREYGIIWKEPASDAVKKYVETAAALYRSAKD